MGKRLVGLALVVGVLPGLARAQTLSEQDRAVAAEFFDEGTLAFERGDYSDAATAFRRAYELTQHPDLLYNIYSAQERNGELEEAAEALEGYLRDGAPESDRREALELRLGRLRQRIEEARQEAAAAEAAAAEERAAAAARLEAEQGERAAAEARAAQARVGRMEQVQAGHATSDALTVAGSVGLGIGGAGLVVFAVFAGLSEAEDAALAGRCGRNAGMVCREEDVDSLRTFNTVSDVTLISGVGVAVIGAALVLIGEAARPGDETEALSVRAAVGPNGAGLAMEGRW